MTRLASLCLAAALLSGCATRYQRAKTIAIVAGTLTLATGSAVLSSAGSDREEAVTIAVWFFLPSLVALAVALPNVIARDRELAERRRDEALRAQQVAAQARQEALVRTRDRAWMLTKEAAAAARGGNCIQVAVFDREVRASDAEFHATVFARDVAIHRCLAP